jgi:hypothetical protein
VIKKDRSHARKLEMIHAFEFGAELEKMTNGGYPNALLNPPTVFKATPEVSTVARHYMLPRPHKYERVVFDKKRVTMPFLVQTVKKIATPNLFVKVRYANHTSSVLRLEDFQRGIPDMEALKHELYNIQIPRLKKVLDTYPKLYFDFQIILDVHGKVHHIDLDRVFSVGAETVDSAEDRLIKWETLLEVFEMALKKPQEEEEDKGKELQQQENRERARSHGGSSTVGFR